MMRPPPNSTLFPYTTLFRSNPGCTAIDLSGGTVDLPAARNTEKTVSFTNETNLGSVKICKVAGPGITAGTPFTFTVTVGTGAPQTVTINRSEERRVGKERRSRWAPDH